MWTFTIFYNWDVRLYRLFPQHIGEDLPEFLLCGAAADHAGGENLFILACTATPWIRIDCEDPG